MSNLTVSQISGPAANSNQITVPTGHVLYAPGHIVQVVNTFLTDQFTVSIPANAATVTDITGLSASITPKSASSRIYVLVRWFGEASAGGIWNTMFNLKRDGNTVGQPSGTGAKGIHGVTQSYDYANYSTTPEMTFFDYMDSPGSASPITYQVCIQSSSAYTLYTNRTVSVDESGTSSITLMEIAQ